MNSANTLPNYPKLSRRFRLQFEPTQGRWVLLYPEGMVQLNASATEILRRCDGARDIQTIVAELVAAFNVANIDAEVRNLLLEGQRRGWIE